MLILGIDPGADKSALCVIDTDSRIIGGHDYLPSEAVEFMLRHYPGGVVEKPRLRGWKAGKSMGETIRWAGIFEAHIGNALTPLEIGQILTGDSPGTREDAFFGVARWFGVLQPEQIPGWESLNRHEKDATRVAVAWAIKEGGK